MRDFFNKPGERASVLPAMQLLSVPNQFQVWNWPDHLLGPGNEKHFATFAPVVGIMVTEDEITIGLEGRFQAFQQLTERVGSTLNEFQKAGHALGIGLTKGDEEDQELYPDVLWLTIIAPTKQAILDFATATSLPGEEEAE